MIYLSLAITLTVVVGNNPLFLQKIKSSWMGSGCVMGREIQEPERDHGQRGLQKILKSFKNERQIISNQPQFTRECLCEMKKLCNCWWSACCCWVAGLVVPPHVGQCGSDKGSLTNLRLILKGVIYGL